MSESSKKQAVLVAFYNRKALGVRYLETALEKAGYTVKIIFYKDFNSINPKGTTKKELQLLCQEIKVCSPVFVGLSVMSSMYLDTVYCVLNAIKKETSAPIVCGGAYASMFPEQLFHHGADFVIRSDGEHAICRLADALIQQTDWKNIPSLCYQDSHGIIHTNEIADIANDIDEYGIPVINSKLACFIENETLTRGDPQLNTKSYEVIASRGCPFTCSYCCCNNLREMLPRGIHGVRSRSVESVIAELKEAKRQCKNIVFIHFYDEIFPNLPGWVDEFVKQYDKYIHLPFTIWSHPKMVQEETLRKLKRVGLTEVIMGIQSGSEHIRRDIFHRYETQEDILHAISAIQRAGIFWSTFDLMLQHPFETIEDLKESYYLVKQFSGRYELQLHGLNFLPGTDIVDMAIEQGYYTTDEMEEIMYAPMEKQFKTYRKWEASPESQLWYKMIYCWQFKRFQKKLSSYEKNINRYGAEIEKLYHQACKLNRIRYIWKKGIIVMKRFSSFR